MPHISKYPLNAGIQQELDTQVLAFLGETSIKIRQKIFRELFTKTERAMIGKRLVLLLLISRSTPPYKISNALKMSPSTVAIFTNRVERGSFKHTQLWFSQDRIISGLLRFLNRWLLEGGTRSISQVLDEQ